MTYSNEPIEIDGKIFQPLLHLLYVEEPDLGCEGVPEDGAVCGSIVAEDAAGLVIEAENKFPLLPIVCQAVLIDARGGNCPRSSCACCYGFVNCLLDI